MDKKIYAYIAGYGNQYWLSVMQPTFEGQAKGVNVCELDGETGALRLINHIDGIESPATLVVSPDGRYLYAANESKDFRAPGYGGGLTAFRLLEGGGIELINDSLAYGSYPAYICIDKTGKYLLVACHGSYYCVSRYEKSDGGYQVLPQRDEGVVTLFKVREDGGIGECLDRLVLEGTGIDPLLHASAHPHSVLINDDDKIVIPNKGGDNIYVARLNRQTEKLETLSVFKTELGSSPRHPAFVEGTPYVLVVNEYDGRLCSYAMNEEGALQRISRVDTMDETVPTRDCIGFSAEQHPWACDVQLHPNKRFVYCNNAQNIISLFELDAETGELSRKTSFTFECSNMSRGMQITRDGRFLLLTHVQDSKVLSFSINQETGALTLADEETVPTPTAIRFIYPNT